MGSNTLVLDRGALREALAILAAVAPRRTCIPALGHVRLSAADGQVALSATDLEMSAVLRLPRKPGGEPVEAALPLGRLVEYVRGAKGPEVALAPDGPQAVVLDGTARLIGIDPGEFPTTPTPEGEPVAVLPAAQLAEAVRTVDFAVSRDRVQYVMTGVFLDLRKRGTSVVATDGKRLAMRQLFRATVRSVARLVLPPKAARILVALASRAGAKGRVEVLLPRNEEDEAEKREATEVAFRVGGDAMSTRLLEGSFPDYKVVIPPDQGPGWAIDRKALAGALERVRPALTEKIRAVRFRLGGGTCSLYARTVDVGEARAKVPAEGGGEAEIALNLDFVREYLDACPKEVERVTLMDWKPGDATVWHGPPRHTYLLMPMKEKIEEPQQGPATAPPVPAPCDATPGQGDPVL